MRFFRRSRVSVYRWNVEQENIALREALKIIRRAKTQAWTDNDHESSAEFRFLCKVEWHLMERENELFDLEFRPAERTENVPIQ